MAKRNYSDYSSDEIKADVWNNSGRAQDFRGVGEDDLANSVHQSIDDGLSELERRGDLR